MFTRLRSMQDRNVATDEVTEGLVAEAIRQACDANFGVTREIAVIANLCRRLYVAEKLGDQAQTYHKELKQEQMQRGKLKKQNVTMKEALDSQTQAVAKISAEADEFQEAMNVAILAKQKAEDQNRQLRLQLEELRNDNAGAE